MLLNLSTSTLEVQHVNYININSISLCRRFSLHLISLLCFYIQDTNIMCIYFLYNISTYLQIIYNILIISNIQCRYVVDNMLMVVDVYIMCYNTNLSYLTHVFNSLGRLCRTR